MPRTLFAVKSCHAFRDRANAVRQTWGAEAMGGDLRFFVGGGEAMCADEVVLDVPDGYAGLPAKTQAICRWAVEHEYDYAWLLDDDTYLRPERLLDHPRQDYVGRVRCASGDMSITPAAYCSGFMYGLSARSLQAMAEAEPYGDDAEDRYVGNSLFKVGIAPENEPRFRVMVSQRNACCVDEPPLPSNDLIAVCEFIGAKMYDAHEQWINHKPSVRKPHVFPDGPLSDVCVLVKTFLRDGLLYRCLDGLERFYPDAKIVVVDDGQGSKQKNTLYPNLRDRGHACICLPFDSGFGAKANAGIPHCDRPYVLIGSDDFDFSHPDTRQGIERMVGVLEGDPTIHIVSGRVNGAPYEALLEIGEDWVRERPGHKEKREVNGVTYLLTDLTVNFSLIRRECLGPGRLYWDGGAAKIGQGEHGSLFFDAKKLGYGVAVIPDAHIREMNWDFSQVHPMYPQYRARARQPERLCFKARGIQKYFLMHGGVEVTP